MSGSKVVDKEGVDNVPVMQPVRKLSLHTKTMGKVLWGHKSTHQGSRLIKMPIHLKERLD